ncbi:6-phosphogluconolactonase [Thermomicrobium sp. CFH 73360]|uniref:6-phosphogluconolactonase n=1 Tax=Thermomicrobium sp. CFH 73360 TaxID=2951987 RepID=UPI0020766FFC|nr:6-phosphogluconolactonase [Thermomicrobium sp. CFH 73360]MCM8745022.1 6-phosphogluconolactonase [Thermomicrobium sp. CFH 73360]
MSCRLEVLRDERLAAGRAAHILTETLAAAIQKRGWASIALAGGRTPRLLYELLAQPPFRDAVAWEQIEWFWGDERMVPPDHDESNYRMAAEILLTVLAIPADRIHRVPTELGPEQAALAYEATMRAAFGVSEDEVPRFDLILLGMGQDGHIASLFPHTPALEETRRLVVANPVPALSSTRITITPVVLQAARAVLVLVTGSEKAQAVRRALEERLAPVDIPAHLLATVPGEVTWILDQAAASQLHVEPGPCPKRQ